MYIMRLTLIFINQSIATDNIGYKQFSHITTHVLTKEVNNTTAYPRSKRHELKTGQWQGEIRYAYPRSPLQSGLLVSRSAPSRQYYPQIPWRRWPRPILAAPATGDMRSDGLLVTGEHAAMSSGGHDSWERRWLWSGGRRSAPSSTNLIFMFCN